MILNSKPSTAIPLPKKLSIHRTFEPVACKILKSALLDHIWSHCHLDC